MSEYGPTGAPPVDGDEVQAAVDDIAQTVYKALWSIHEHRQAKECGPAGGGATGPSHGHSRRPASPKRA